MTVPLLSAVAGIITFGVFGDAGSLWFEILVFVLLSVVLDLAYLALRGLWRHIRS